MRSEYRDEKGSRKEEGVIVDKEMRSMVEGGDKGL